jgi:transposase-like protein
MINVTEFKSLAEFMEHFHDEQTCREHFAAIRFRNGAYCPHCGHGKVYTFGNGKRYRCADCKKDFTIVTGTVFGETKLPLRKWFIGIYLLANSSKGISSVQLAQHAGVTQKTAWFMDHRLRSAMKQNKGKLAGTIEADETFIGGLSKNMHKKEREKKITGTGGVDKAAVFGIKERDGEVRAEVVPSVRKKELHKAIKKNVAKGSTVFTDQWVGYRGLKLYKHDFVNHGAKEYVRGDVHTNSIESFWALFKRAYHGIYHQMSKKHLQKYVDECAFRLNLKSEEKGFHEIFAETVTRASDGQHLPYKELIA